MELDELVESVDILEYISQYTDFEERNGEYWALSPLKQENTPSFSVNTDLNRFYDFSSGKGGTVLSFIMAYNHCGTRQAEQILRQYAHDNNVEGHAAKRMESAKVARRFVKRSHRTKEPKSAILPADYMTRYKKDYEKLAIWEDEGISRASMDKFEVYYDDFSSRIVYPIRDINGYIINVSGRTVDPDWKAKRLRKYTYFKPLGVLDTIYGLAENREDIKASGEIILFEGAKSVMFADTWDIHNTGAVMTSHLNPCQLKILVKLGARVVFALDKGINIREDENIKRLKRYVPVEYIYDADNLLEDKMSPVDAGYETWQKLYEGRVKYR